MRKFHLPCFYRPAIVTVGALLLAGGSVANGEEGDLAVISVDANGIAVTGAVRNDHVVSADGRIVAFTSWASNLVPGDTNGYEDVFVRDRQTGVTERVSVGPGGIQTDGDSYYPSISADGRFVSFESSATNLDPTGSGGIYVHDRRTGLNQRVDFAFDGNTLRGSDFSSISADGRYVVFESWASNLVPNDTNGAGDIFVRDLQSDAIERVSVDSSGAQLRYTSAYPSISADGRFVSFCVIVSNYYGQGDIYVHDRQTGLTELVSVNSNGEHGNFISELSSISADGRYVAFLSAANNLVPGDPMWNDIYLRDRLLGVTERISQSHGEGGDNPNSTDPSISADGRFVSFRSRAIDLVPNDTNGMTDVFVYDRRTGITQRVNLNADGTQSGGDQNVAWGTGPSLTADGRYVVFDTGAGLVTSDVNGGNDVYIRDQGPPTSGPFSLTLRPSALNFGVQTLFTWRTQSFWLRNAGTVPLAINSVDLRGAQRSDFRVTRRCGSSVAVSGSCRIDVTFKPTSVGAKSASLFVLAGGTLVRTRALSGTGVRAELTVLPTSLSFGRVKVQATSAVKYVTITNTAAGLLPIHSIRIDGNNPLQFKKSSACPATVAVGGSCTVRVAFKPTTTGYKSATLLVDAGGGAPTKYVALSGKGVQ